MPKIFLVRTAVLFKKYANKQIHPPKDITLQLTLMFMSPAVFHVS
jgi:hypothetical protein